MAIEGTDGTIKGGGIVHRTEEATAALRFVERYVDFAGTIKPVRILQQQWLITVRDERAIWDKYEWRDVPLEVEVEVEVEERA